MVDSILIARDPNGRVARLRVMLDTDAGIAMMRLLSANCMSITNAIEDYSSQVAASFPMEPEKFIWLYMDSEGEPNRVELSWDERRRASSPRWRSVDINLKLHSWMKEIVDAS